MKSHFIIILILYSTSLFAQVNNSEEVLSNEKLSDRKNISLSDKEIEKVKNRFPIFCKNYNESIPKSSRKNINLSDLDMEKVKKRFPLFFINNDKIISKKSRKNINLSNEEMENVKKRFFQY